MKMNTRTLCAAIAFLCSAPAVASAQARVGITTKADVRAAMGTPNEFTVRVPPGGVDLTLDAGGGGIGFLGLPPAGPTVEYDVLQYRDWERPAKPPVSFVFEAGDDRLLYAVIEASSSERTIDDATERYGKKPVLETHSSQSGCIVETNTHLVFADDGVELVVGRNGIEKKILIYRDSKGRVMLPRQKRPR